MKKIIHQILNHPELTQHPPVLLDIGAAGFIHREWKIIAPYCICVAFDGDSRDFNFAEKTDSGFKKLYVYHAVVSDQNVSESNFYLTKSPHCSSLLKPDELSLKKWMFGDLFQVEKTVKMKTVNLIQVLAELGIKNIDWFKCDTQGTDLRIFQSLQAERIQRVLAAEFEPGIISAYQNEDSLPALMAAMKSHPFWMNAFVLKGSQRLDAAVKKNMNLVQRNLVRYLLPKSPGWAELSYLNNFQNTGSLGKREYLLGWVVALIKNQDGFAMELALMGHQQFADPLFLKLAAYSQRRLWLKVLFLPMIVLKSFLKKII